VDPGESETLSLSYQLEQLRVKKATEYRSTSQSATQEQPLAHQPQFIPPPVSPSPAPTRNISFTVVIDPQSQRISNLLQQQYTKEQKIADIHILLEQENDELKKIKEAILEETDYKKHGKNRDKVISKNKLKKRRTEHKEELIDLQNEDWDDRARCQYEDPWKDKRCDNIARMEWEGRDYCKKCYYLVSSQTTIRGRKRKV
jgi:hypothetical protein